MRRRRKQRTQQSHYCLIVNRRAANYRKQLVDELVSRIRDRQGYFTFVDAPTPDRTMAKARYMLGLSRSRKPLPQVIARRGPFTGIIACGGDGTFNMAARLALQADIPVGLVPMGKTNNLARAYFGNTAPNLTAAVSGNYRTVDIARAGRVVFFGSFGLGLPVELREELENGKRPFFGIGWTRLGNRVGAQIKVHEYDIQIDSFSFTASPLMFGMFISPYLAGLTFSPTSEVDDGRAEIVFDHGCTVGELGTFVRQVSKGDYYYGDAIRLYRGTLLRIHPLKGRRMYVDGEIVISTDDALEIKIEAGALRLFSA